MIEQGQERPPDERLKQLEDQVRRTLSDFGAKDLTYFERLGDKTTSALFGIAGDKQGWQARLDFFGQEEEGTVLENRGGETNMWIYGRVPARNGGWECKWRQEAVLLGDITRFEAWLKIVKSPHRRGRLRITKQPESLSGWIARMRTRPHS